MSVSTTAVAVLSDLVTDHPTRFGGPATVDRVAKMAADCRADLEHRAVLLGLRIYAESPKALGRRVAGYWAAACDGPELATGELADVVQGGNLAPRAKTRIDGQHPPASQRRGQQQTAQVAGKDRHRMVEGEIG